jgi:hypothetical protein
VRVRLENLHVSVGLNVARPDFSTLRYIQVERLGRVDVHLERDLLQIEDDVSRVFHGSRNRRELVQHSLDLHRRDRRAFNRREQHAPHRVANGRAEPALERLRVKSAEPVGERLALELQPLGPLKTFPEHFSRSFRVRAPNHPGAARPAISLPASHRRSGSAAGGELA